MSQDDMEEIDRERLLEWKLMTVDHQEMNTWRSAVPAAKQPPGRGPIAWFPRALESLDNHKKVPCMEKSWNLQKPE